MSDDEDTSGGWNTFEFDEGGYDSSGSYLDIDESCVSSIDFCYSEEENYVSDNDDTYDGDEIKLLNKDISAAISEPVPDSKMVYIRRRKEHEFSDDNSSNMQCGEIIFGTHTVKFFCAGTAAPILLHSTCDWRNVKDGKCDSELAESVDDPKSEMPSRTAWKATWLEKREKSDKLLVNVYAYFKKGKLFGGHAVIIRNMSAIPIAAAAYFTRFGLSYLHNMLLALVDGIKLASDHGCSSPTIVCNSRFVAQVLKKVASHSCDCNIKTGGSICVSCTSKFAPSLDELYWKNLAPYIEAVQSKQGSSTIEWDSGKNVAVHYLAKLVKTNSLYHGYRVDRWDMKKPEDYTDELVDILLKDAFNPEERIGILDVSTLD